MDGTLVDSMKYWKNLGREYLASRGVTEGVDEGLKQISSMTMTESSAFFVRTFGLAGTPDQIASEMNQIMDDHYRNDVELKPGVAEYLEELSRKHVKMCVASATANHLVEACLKRAGILQYFEFLLSCEEVGAGKYRPDVYYEAAGRLGAKPEETAVYEDALYAAKTAKEAGFYVIGVYDGSADASWEELGMISDEVIGGRPLGESLS